MFIIAIICSIILPTTDNYYYSFVSLLIYFVCKSQTQGKIRHESSIMYIIAARAGHIGRLRRRQRHQRTADRRTDSRFEGC